ncbi:MAG: D-sedoheptulose-7-phosphate isomerase [Tepidisphaeraceae bacterium]
MQPTLSKAIGDLRALLPVVEQLGPELARLAEAMLRSWNAGGKVLIAGNGGSAADAMHFAEELVVRYGKNRRALAAMALCDPTVLTCAANDYGYEAVFSRQVEAFGNRGDVLIVLTTSGRSPNLGRAVTSAKSRGMLTASFLGKDGGPLKGACDIELLVPSEQTGRIQECHKLLYHALCEWVDEQVE